MVQASYLSPKKLLAARMELPGEPLIGNAIILNNENEYLYTANVKLRKEIFKAENSPRLCRNIPNTSERMLANIGKRGIIKRGSAIRKGDLIICMTAPLQEQYMNAEEKLLREIYGEADERDVSIRMPYKGGSIVVETNIIKDKKSRNIEEIVEVLINITRRLEVGDVLQDCNGNKGVIVKKRKLPIVGEYEDIDIVVGSESFIPSFENIKMKNIWRIDRKPHLLILTDESDLEEVAKAHRNIGYVHEKAKRYELLGQAIIGYLPLQRITDLCEEKITAISTGPYTPILRQPYRYDEFTSLPRGANLTEKKISALMSCPEMLKEALILKSDADKGIKNIIYDALMRNGKF